MLHTDFWLPIKLSLQTASIALIIALIAGIMLARVMTKRRFIGHTVIETVLLLPIVLPPTVIGFLLIVIFGINSPVGSLIESIFGSPIIFTPWAAVIAAVVVALPLMYQSVKTGFQSIDEGIEEAARMDGASSWNVFFYITLPLSIKSIITGSILSFARALGEFGATLMFAGNIPGKTQTVPTAIYIAMESGDTKLAWLWAGSIIFISFIMLYILSLLKK